MSSIINEQQEYKEVEWVHNGIQCVILRHPSMSHSNGYVQVPALATIPSAEYLDDLFDIHGGITYGPDDEGWVGFDTAHAGDVWPGRPDRFRSHDIYEGHMWRQEWTLDRLKSEVNRLAEQAAAL